MWDKAAICSHIFEFLRDEGGPVGEHSLIRHLDAHHCFVSFLTEPANLQLFRKHFITRHCLYSLQESLASQWVLEIGLLEVGLRRIDAAGSDSSTEVGRADAALRDYYLDLKHLEQADLALVDGLLKGFWQRFAAHVQSPAALAVLELDDKASWADVQLAYRRKAQRAHPDRGGSATEFAALQEAYEALRKHFNR